SGVTTLEIEAAVAGGEGGEDQEPTIDLEGVDVQNLVFSGGLTGTVQLANTATTLAVTVDGETPAEATLDFVNAEELTLNLEGAGVGKDGEALTLTGDKLSTVTVNAAADSTAETATGYNLVLDDVS